MMILLFVVYGALFAALASIPIWIEYDSWANSRSRATWEDQADTRLALFAAQPATSVAKPSGERYASAGE